MAKVVCLYFFVAKETDGLIQQAIQNGERDTAVFCDHLSTLDRTSEMSSMLQSSTLHIL